MAKATKADETRRELIVAQLSAVDLLVTGKTDQVTAEAIGLTRQTVDGWRHVNSCEGRYTHLAEDHMVRFARH